MDDSGIIDLYWHRHDTAIAQTEQKYGQYCRVIAFNILHNREDADECANDTYLAAWNAIPPQRPGRLSAFLGRITRNIALNKYDYYNADKRSSAFTMLLSELEECLPSQDDVVSQYEAGETSRLITGFLQGQSHECRTVFLRRYWFSDTITEIAARFGMSESKVKSILFRTRKKLKQHLEKEGVTL